MWLNKIAVILHNKVEKSNCLYTLKKIPSREILVKIFGQSDVLALNSKKYFYLKKKRKMQQYFEWYKPRFIRIDIHLNGYLCAGTDALT